MHTTARFCAYIPSSIKDTCILGRRRCIRLSFYFNKTAYASDFQAFKERHKLLITFSSFISLIIRKYVTLRLEYLYNNVNTDVI